MGDQEPPAAAFLQRVEPVTGGVLNDPEQGEVGIALHDFMQGVIRFEHLVKGIATDAERGSGDLNDRFRQMDTEGNQLPYIDSATAEPIPNKTLGPVTPSIPTASTSTERPSCMVLTSETIP